MVVIIVIGYYQVVIDIVIPLGCLILRENSSEIYLEIPQLKLLLLLLLFSIWIYFSRLWKPGCDKIGNEFVQLQN